MTAGPFGGGASRLVPWGTSAGLSLNQQREEGMLGGPEGTSLGLEAGFLGEGLADGGVGVLYWFGRPDAPGTTLFLRGGARSTGRSVEGTTMTLGIGLLWRMESGLGFQFDYAAVPMGSLGLSNYATLAVRISPISGDVTHESGVR